MKEVLEHGPAFRPILRAALSVADPRQAVHRALIRKGNRLLVQGREYHLETFGKIFVLGAGKASVFMGEALEEVMGDRISEGWLVAPHGATGPLKNCSVLTAGHPVPDRHGLKAAEILLKKAQTAGPDDLVIVLLSGGASALLPAPVAKITLREKRRTTEWLLKSGARINEINIVRKHLSRIKGGRLAEAIYPASSLTLIQSDVLGSDLSTIASGPMVPDPSCFGDAIAILKQYAIWSRMPDPVCRYLKAGLKGKYPETPKPGSAVFEKTSHFIVSDNRASVDAAVTQAQTLGFHVIVLTTSLQGEAREIARVFGAIAREIHQTSRPLPRPACILAGGELTVTVKGRGRGGRAQEFVLATAMEIAGSPNTTIIGFGTDGMDGPTQAAGAIADGMTLERARNKGLDLTKALSDNNAYAVLKSLGDLILTGPTGTNVNDLYLLLMPKRTP